MSHSYQGDIPRRGMMLVLASPSGAGKSSISKKLLESEKRLVLSVSATTRERRPGETVGVDYHFSTLEEFNHMIADGAFLEYAKVFGHYYGTPKALVDESLEKGIDVLFDIDWQGTQQIAQQSRGDLVSVFVLPPSTGELEVRLKNRAQDSDEVVAQRMAQASDEMSHWAEYDYVIVNNDLNASVEEVRAILHAERLKRTRQRGLASFVKALRSGQ